MSGGVWDMTGTITFFRSADNDSADYLRDRKQLTDCVSGVVGDWRPVCVVNGNLDLCTHAPRLGAGPDDALATNHFFVSQSS